MITFLPTDSLIGLGFRPGSIKKQTLRMSYSHNDTPNGPNNNGSPTETTAKLVFRCFSKCLCMGIGKRSNPSIFEDQSNSQRLVAMDVSNKKANEFSIKGSASFKKSLELLSVPKLFAVLTVTNASLISCTAMVLKWNVALC